MSGWTERAEELQEVFYRHYWNERTAIMNQWYPEKEGSEGENYYYWWQAHAIDVLVDGWERSRDGKYLERARRLARGLKASNGGTYRHDYYDDMEWTALALLRMYDHTGEEEYKLAVLDLWADIQTAWNGHMGGGLAWNKNQLDYKNTPANAPAAILAARLYVRFGAEDDLAWGKRIYEWNLENLVDRETGFVWDGMNRLGDGRIDYDWDFTYCQGVMIGAGLELHAITSENRYLREAERTARATIDRLVDSATGMLPDEGIDDTGLFKGILVRYIKLLIDRKAEGSGEWKDILRRNGEALWNRGIDRTSGSIGPSWSEAPAGPIQLSVRLSGVMLAEALAGLGGAVE
ncbi:glycosyl hydrolase [Cohnella sp. LGH]|uniref:glycoside hydrolase family 76 protein n=1 Tax=Cohnella sp. LGH TaxID=1619153 RepID=UPI001ADAC198|nr:glycoside hydrolase family 76 protein [Cohnella sp. LGH]QTH44606.1 glycosyl hydrolase [Cohnella sp. LGH]